MVYIVKKNKLTMRALNNIILLSFLESFVFSPTFNWFITEFLW